MIIKPFYLEIKIAYTNSGLEKRPSLGDVAGRKLFRMIYLFYIAVGVASIATKNQDRSEV